MTALNETIKFIQQGIIKGRWKHRKNDFETYLLNLEKLKNKKHGKKNTTKKKDNCEKS